MTKTISIRISEKLAELLERDARKETRSISTQARHIITLYYRSKGEINGEDAVE